MKKKYEKIFDKRAQVSKLEKEWTESAFEKKEDYSIWSKKSKAYKRARFSFVCLCIRYRLSYQQTADLMCVTKARVYQIYRYGLSGEPSAREKKEIRERDKNLCFICRKKSTMLHIHHIGNPRSKKPSNLITLCVPCHGKQDAAKRKSKKLSTDKN